MPGHLDVEEEDRGRELVHGARRRGAVGGFRDDVELGPLGREHLAELAAQDLLVFSDDRRRQRSYGISRLMRMVWRRRAPSESRAASP